MSAAPTVPPDRHRAEVPPDHHRATSPPHRHRARHVLGAAALAATLLVGCAAPLPGPAPPPVPEPPRSGLDLAGFDRATKPGDSLFRFANGVWQRDTQIPPDRSEFGTFSGLVMRTEDEQRALIEEATADPDAGGQPDLARKVADLYAGFMDTARLDQLGAAPLAADLAAIDALATPADVTAYLGRLQFVGGSNPIKLTVGPDDRDPGLNVTSADQAGLTLPDREDYLAVDPPRVQLRQRFTGYVSRMLTLAGVPDPDGAAARVLSVETQLARVQTAQGRGGRDVRLPLAQAAARTPGLDWTAYLTAAGVTAPELVLDEPGYLTGLGRLLRTVPVADWRDYLRWHLVSDAAPYLSAPFVDTRFEFFGTVLGGREQNRERWRRGVAAVNAALGDALGRLYVRRYVPPEAKERIEALVGQLRAAFARSVETLDWMSPPTRAQAKDKVARMSVKIGYPDRWQDWSTLDVRRDDLLGSVRRAAELAHRRDLEKVGKPVDPGEWTVDPQTVNATYNPSRNEITFPAGILRPPFYDPRADEAVNYGGIGSVIGHEMCHGFDDRGRRYDGTGKRRDWWTAQDARRFTTRTESLIERFSGFSPLPGSTVDGRLTLGENIADLCGLAMTVRAYRASLAGRTAPVMDGFTGDQRLFLGYAQLWRTKEREESVRQGLRTDPHSPGEFRADGVVNNLDEFYTAFDVKPGDKLFLPPARRIRLW